MARLLAKASKAARKEKKLAMKRERSVTEPSSPVIKDKKGLLAIPEKKMKGSPNRKVSDL